VCCFRGKNSILTHTATFLRLLTVDLHYDIVVPCAGRFTIQIFYTSKPDVCNWWCSTISFFFSLRSLLHREHSFSQLLKAVMSRDY